MRTLAVEAQSRNSQDGINIVSGGGGGGEVFSYRGRNGQVKNSLRKEVMEAIKGIELPLIFFNLEVDSYALATNLVLASY